MDLKKTDLFIYPTTLHVVKALLNDEIDAIYCAVPHVLHEKIYVDIIDSGNTLYQLKKMLIARQPASLNIVTLLDKPERREAPMEPDYTGFVIEDEFVIGYGLDYAEEYRNLPYVGVLKRSVYED